MATLGDRILEAIRYGPLDDDVPARRLGVSHRQSVNQTARRLEAKGLLRRIPGPDRKVVNTLPAQEPPENAPSGGMKLRPAAQSDERLAITSDRRDRSTGDRITEDEVKEAVRAYLAADGFEVVVAWGRVPGIDVDARHRDGRRIVIEAKAEVGSAGAQQNNYLVGMLGELAQRMNDPKSTYAIALPNNRQYRGLVDRLPTTAKERLSLAVYWVDRGVDGLAVTVEAAPRRRP